MHRNPHLCALLKLPFNGLALAPRHDPSWRDPASGSGASSSSEGEAGAGAGDAEARQQRKTEKRKRKKRNVISSFFNKTSPQDELFFANNSAWIKRSPCGSVGGIYDMVGFHHHALVRRRGMGQI